MTESARCRRCEKAEILVGKLSATGPEKSCSIRKSQWRALRAANISDRTPARTSSCAISTSSKKLELLGFELSLYRVVGRSVCRHDWGPCELSMARPVLSIVKVRYGTGAVAGSGETDLFYSRDCCEQWRRLNAPGTRRQPDIANDVEVLNCALWDPTWGG